MPDEDSPFQDNINAPENGRASEEVENMIMKMHSKMKNLESRYLDLANFYKKELLINGGQNLNNLRVSANLGGSELSPYL